ncbi:hypothetical protein [Methylobacterium oryzae]|uniref:hypothetical protein n=1 Tax=Methylobacterium oryzae TaxID=334852 RepID=UPI001F19E119|nr:hypothetical protein [Methylobacterium oryzae]UIN36913.1 hypothetical protein LXM90_10625 [Methylobacterium oryzae]
MSFQRPPPEGHDFPLDFHWRTKPSFIARAGVSLAGHPRAQEARNSIMTSLARAALAGRGSWVSYSRSKRFYAPLARYEGTAYTYDRVLAAVDELLALGLIEEERALPGPASHGWQSRIRATDRLLAAFRNCPFQHVWPRDVIELRDASGERMAYVDTDHTRRLRRVIEARNEALGAISVKMPEKNGWIHTPGHVSVRSDKTGNWVSLRPLPIPQVVRIYGRGRWDMHGRLYGWWQQLPASRRLELLINGEVAFEEDWRACHPTLLYAMAGKVPVGEIYDVAGYDPRHVKAALLTVMNTKRTYGGVLSLMKREEDDPGAWPHSLDYTKGLMKAVLDRHKPIAHLLGADMGIRLMHVESEMCVEVLKRSERQNIPALPVHDSFVTPASKGTALTAIMTEVMEAKCAEINHSRPSIKAGIPPQMGAALVSRVSAAASAPVSPAREAASNPSSFASSITGPAKAVSRPLQTVEKQPAPSVAPTAFEAPGRDWDLAERTEALTAHFERKGKAELAYAHHILGLKVDLRETRSSRARAREEAEEMAQREWTEGRRLVDRVPDRLSDKEKALRAKAAAPRAPRLRRPMPRPRRPSTCWGQPEAAPTLVKAKPQEASPRIKAKPEATVAPVKAKSASRPARSLAALLRTRDPMLVPEEQGPGWTANPRRRPDGITARAHAGVWRALGRVPSEPEGGHEPPGGPVATPRAATGCAPYPSRPRAW